MEDTAEFSRRRTSPSADRTRPSDLLCSSSGREQRWRGDVDREGELDDRPAGPPAVRQLVDVGERERERLHEGTVAARERERVQLGESV